MTENVSRDNWEDKSNLGKDEKAQDRHKKLCIPTQETLRIYQRRSCVPKDFFYTRVERSFQDEKVESKVLWPLSNHKLRRKSGISVGTVTFPIWTTWCIPCIILQKFISDPFQLILPYMIEVAVDLTLQPLF